MEKSIKGTRTEQNLLKSFAGESQARSRYTFFASVAKKEGYEQIAGVFMETAEQEKEHAKRFFKFLEGGMVEITASYPAGMIGTTAENLAAAAAGENEEWVDLYPAFADIADEEGFKEIAVAFRMIAKVEAETRKTLPSVVGECGSKQGIRKRRSYYVAMSQLWFRIRRQESSGEMSGLCTSAGLLRTDETELLIRVFDPIRHEFSGFVPFFIL